MEALPEELTGVADEVHLHFPWGSLLRGVLLPDESVLQALRRVCKRDSLIENITSIDRVRDLTELNRLGIADCVQDNYIEEILLPKYLQAKLELREQGLIPATNWPTLCSSWSAKLKSGGSRDARYLIAQAV